MTSLPQGSLSLSRLQIGFTKQPHANTRRKPLEQSYAKCPKPGSPDTTQASAESPKRRPARLRQQEANVLPHFEKRGDFALAARKAAAHLKQRASATCNLLRLELMCATCAVHSMIRSKRELAGHGGPRVWCTGLANLACRDLRENLKHLCRQKMRQVSRMRLYAVTCQGRLEMLHLSVCLERRGCKSIALWSAQLLRVPLCTVGGVLRVWFAECVRCTIYSRCVAW